MTDLFDIIKGIETLIDSCDDIVKKCKSDFITSEALSIKDTCQYYLDNLNKIDRLHILITNIKCKKHIESFNFLDLVPKNINDDVNEMFHEKIDKAFHYDYNICYNITCIISNLEYILYNYNILQ